MDSAGTIVSVIALAITLVLFMIQASQTRRLAEADLLLRLRESFDTREMRLVRARAALGIRQADPTNVALSEVLDWMSQVAWLLEGDVIKQQLAYRQFSYWLFGYWDCGKSFVDQRRTHEPGSWKSLESLPSSGAAQ